MSLYSKVDAFITACNETTGQDRKDLTAGIQDLVDGYGQGGGVTVVTGTFTLAQDGGVGAYEVQGDFSNVIAVIVTAEKTDVQSATKTKNSLYVQVVPMLPDCTTDRVQISTANYTGYTGYWEGYNTNNAVRNGICTTSRSIGIKEDKTSILFSPGAVSEPVYVANVTYTYHIYKATL